MGLGGAGTYEYCLVEGRTYLNVPYKDLWKILFSIPYNPALHDASIPDPFLAFLIVVNGASAFMTLD